MPRRNDLSPLAKSCHWLADTVMRAVFVAAARTGTTSKYDDLEMRLTLALEAYGETVRGGDLARVAAVLRELETGIDATRRSSGGHYYYDPMNVRDGRRYGRRKLDSLRKRLERLTAADAPSRKTRGLQEEIAKLEQLFADQPV